MTNTITFSESEVLVECYLDWLINDSEISHVISGF